MDNEAACVALAEGTAKNAGAFLLVYAPWAIAAQRDIGLWAERVPTEVNPADFPPRDRDLFFETEPAQGLLSPKAILSICDFSWMAPQIVGRAYCELKQKINSSPSENEPR